MALVWILSGLVWTLMAVNKYTAEPHQKFNLWKILFNHSSFSNLNLLKLLKSLPQISNLGQLMEGYFASTKGWA